MQQDPLSDINLTPRVSDGSNPYLVEAQRQANEIRQPGIGGSTSNAGSAQNPYLTFLQQPAEAPSQSPAIASIAGTMSINPDQAAQASRLGKEFGLGQDIALRNMEELRRRSLIYSLERNGTMERNPVLSQWMMNPANAAMAHDDISSLSRLEKIEEYLYALPEEFGAGFSTGQIQVATGKIGSNAMVRGLPTTEEWQAWNAYQSELQTLSGDAGFWRQTGELVGQMASTGKDVLEAATVGALYGGTVAAVGGQLGPQVVIPEEILTVPAGMIIGAKAGAVGALFTSSARTMAGNNYMKNLEIGRDPDISRFTALGVGVIGGALETYGTKLVAKPLGGLWSRLVSEAANEAIVKPTVGKAMAKAGIEWLKATGGEIGTETAQQITEIALDEVNGFASDPAFESRFATAEGRRGIKNELVDVFVRTAMGVSVVGSIGPGANLLIDTRRASRAKNSQRVIAETVAAIDATKLKARNPDALEEYADDALDETQAYIRGSTLRQLLTDAKVSDADLDAIVPGLSARVREAETAGNFVSMPLAQFGVRFGGTPLGDAMVPHLTIDPRAMTPTELAAFEQQRQELTAEAEKLLEAKTATDEAFVQEADEIHASVKQRLVTAGRDELAADAEATIYQAMIVTAAAREGMTPQQYADQYGLREIVGEGQAAQAQALEQAEQFTPEGERRTDTPEFKAWSNEAPVIANAQSEAHQFTTGTPVVVEALHGSTERGLRRFDVGRAVEVPGAIFFTSNPAVAEQYTYERAYGDIISDQPTGDVIRAYVAFANPMVYQPKGKVVDAIEMDRAIEQAKAAGHDGLIIKNIDDSIGMTGDMGDVYVTWNPTSIKSVDNRGTWSRETTDIYAQASRLDADYMAAVEQGDMATAQRMVDEAADATGYNEDGSHGLAKGKLVGGRFDPKLLGSNTGAPSAKLGFFFGSRSTAATYAFDIDQVKAREHAKKFQDLWKQLADRIPAQYRDRLQVGYELERGDDAFFPTAEIDASGIQIAQSATTYYATLNDVGAFALEDILSIEDSMQTVEGEEKAGRELLKWTEKTWLPAWNRAVKLAAKEVKSTESSILNVKLRMANPFVFDFKGERYREKSYAEVIADAKRRGHDSVILKNTYDGGGLDDIKVVFRPEQIKSADPVTRDESGNVVPLSRRFDITSPKIFEQAAVPASLDAVANVESAFAFAGTRAFKTNREFKQDLQDRVLNAAKLAGIDLSNDTPEVEQYLVRVAIADAITALRTNPNAVGWYNEKVTKALRLVSLIHPEIATDPRAKFAFTWALAVTSNGLEVNKNFQLAEQAYREYKQTGQMPTNLQAGQAQIAINASLGLFNDLVAKYGIDAVEKFMTTKTTVKEVMAYTNKNVSGENLTTEVYGAAALGPKIGNGFFANLYGYFEQLTMDRWLMRTWGRWTGTLLDDNTANIATKRKQLTAMIRALSAEDKKALEKILGSKLSTTTPEKVAVAIQKISIKPANRVAMAKIGPADAAAQSVFSSILGEPARGIQRVSYGDELRKLGNALAKYLDGQKEAPSGPPERARIRRVMSKVLAELQTQFPSLTMSDLQALLWYPEKRLYDAAKTADEGKTGYEDNEAPDYANAAANLARASGVDEGVISNTIASVDAELSAITAERAAGAERGIGNLVLRQDAQSARAGFEQAARGLARGGFDPQRMRMFLTSKQDASTTIHELMHFALQSMTDLARSGNASPQVLADLDLLFQWRKEAIAGDTPQARLVTWLAMPIDQQRTALQEPLAYNGEIYIFEGKAPTEKLQPVFDRLRAFMLRVYKSIRDEINAIYRQQFGEDLPMLTPEVRGVFDRIMASDYEIRQQAAVNEMRPQFQTQKPSEMDDATWAAYQEMQQEAMDASITDLSKASLRQMQWLSGARAKVLRDMQEKHAALRREVTVEMAAAVRVDNVYRALTFLRYGKFIDADGQEVEIDGPHKLDLETVKQMYELEPEALRPDVTAMARGKYGFVGADGLNPDMVAEMFGYTSGDQMIRAVLAAKPIKEEIKARTDAEMTRRYGDMNTRQAQEAEVQKALHNEARARMVAVELRWTAKMQQPVRVLLDAAKSAAEQVIGRKRIRDLRPSEFVTAEAQAFREASSLIEMRDPSAAAQAAATRAYNEAVAAGKTADEATADSMAAGVAAADKARTKLAEFDARYPGMTREQQIYTAKRHQLLNNQMARAALQAREQVDKDVKYLRRVLRDKSVERMGADAADQIAQLLERFEVAAVSLKRLDERKNLAQYMAEMEEQGLVPNIAPKLIAETNRVNYREMTVDQFNDLVEAVKQIEYIGKNARKLQLANERVAFNDKRDEIVTRIRATGRLRGLDLDPRSPLTNIGRTIARLQSFAAAHLKAASVAFILDGGKEDGPLWNTVIRTANDAADMETRMRSEATAKLAEILKPVFALGRMGGKGKFFQSVNRSLNREAVIAIALNMGNAGNMQRLLDGEGWTMDQVQPIMQSLTAAEWNAVQQVWDYLETYRPLIAAKERRLYGKEPNWVEPQPLTVQTADGQSLTLRGGYYPVKYDPVASDRVAMVDEVQEAKDALRGTYTAATTRRSFTKDRAEKVVGRPILYTLDAAFSGVNDVIHDLAWHEWLISTNRLLRDETFANAVRETRGPEFLRQLREWAKSNAAGDRPANVEGVLSWLRQGISASGLGFNVMSAALQITGFNQSVVRVGAKWVGLGIAEFTASPFATSQFVRDNSMFMAERQRTQFRELNELRNTVRGKSGVRRVLAQAYVAMMTMQRAVDTPTWVGAYRKALAGGKDHATAVALADQAVKDSQGSGLTSDLAAIERGGPGLKLFTVFYGYMNTVYNMAAMQTYTARGRGKLAADYVLLLVVPVVLSHAIKAALTPDTGDDEFDPEALARKLAAEELSYLMGTMVVVREFGGAAEIVAGAEGVRMGYGGPAGVRAIGEAYNLATQTQQGEFDRAWFRSAINTLGAFTGLPSAQINRTIDGVEAILEDEVEGVEAVVAPVTGVKR